MPSFVSVLTRHKNSQLYEQHLLIQFILSELISAQNELDAIDDLLAKSHASNPFDLPQLLSHFSTLIGSSHSSRRVISWNDDGLLNKIKNYCSLLTNGSELLREANQAWLLAMQSLDTLSVMQQSQTLNSQLIILSLAKLQRSFKRLTKLAGSSLLQKVEDENLIFFLLRHQEQLNALYKTNFVGNLLRKHFKTHEQLRNFLISRYTARGFTQLLPLIEDALKSKK